MSKRPAGEPLPGHRGKTALHELMQRRQELENQIQLLSGRRGITAFREQRQRSQELKDHIQRELRYEHLLYDTLKKAADKSARKLFLWTLHHGTKAQVDSSINRFFRTEKGKPHSFVFKMHNAEDLEYMKMAMEELEVPKTRCFWENEEHYIENVSSDVADIIKYWDQANGLQKSVARLAWLMQEEELNACLL
jgi:hypothetical protein